MVRACLLANAAVHTFVMVDMRLPVGQEANGTLRTVHVAGTSHASTAQVGHHVVGLHASRAGLVHHGQDVFAHFRACQCLAGVFRQRHQFVLLVRDAVAQNGQHFILQHGALLVDATPSARGLVAGRHVDRYTVDFVEQPSFLVQPDELRHQLTPDNQSIVYKSHGVTMVLCSLLMLRSAKVGIFFITPFAPGFLTPPP